MAFTVGKVFTMAIHDQINNAVNHVLVDVDFMLHNSSTCMWCGEEFASDVLDLHEELCGG